LKDLIENLDGYQCLAIMIVSMVISCYFCWLAKLSKDQLERERERNERERAYKTCSSCNEDTQKILFQLCTSCFVEQMDRFDQIVDYEQQIETQVKTAIVMQDEE